MRWPLWISALVIFFLVRVVATAPAALVVNPLAQQNVFLEGVSGTLWQGSAQSLSARANGEVLAWGRLEWAVSPWHLLTLSPEVRFSTDFGAQWMSGVVSIDGLEAIELRNLKGAVPAELARLFAPLSLDGNFEFDFETLLWSKAQGAVEMSGQAMWRQALWAAPSERVPLGDYTVSLASDTNGIAARVGTLSGPVNVEGQVRAADNRYEVDLLINPTGRHEAKLRQNLSLIAVPEAEALRIKLSGKY